MRSCRCITAVSFLYIKTLTIWPSLGQFVQAFGLLCVESEEQHAQTNAHAHSIVHEMLPLGWLITS